MILTGLPANADEMHRCGVVNQVIPANKDVLEEALAFAQIIATRSAPALRLAKHAVKAGKSRSSKRFGDQWTDRSKLKRQHFTPGWRSSELRITAASHFLIAKKALQGSWRNDQPISFKIEQLSPYILYSLIMRFQDHNMNVTSSALLLVSFMELCSR
jgi:hypothetical protein